MSLPEIPEETTYVFRLDPAARWQDAFPTEGGRRVTAQDIVANVQRQVDATDSTGAEDGTFLLSSIFRQLDSFEAIDESPFRMTTAGPNAVILNGTFLNPFAWITSPEAIDEWSRRSDLWRDESTTMRVSATGPWLGVEYHPATNFRASRNRNYWKPSMVPDESLPYIDDIELFNFFDEGSQGAAFRNQQLDAVILNSAAIGSLVSDFGDQVREAQVPGGFTVVIGMNYNAAWEGEDGLGNPWVDRRFAAAFHLATDRFQLIDTVYQGHAKLSALGEAPWFSTFWAPPEEELVTWPGYRPNHEEDVALANALLDASGFRDAGRTLTVLAPDIWEQRFPSIVRTQPTVGSRSEGAGVSCRAAARTCSAAITRA